VPNDDLGLEAGTPPAGEPPVAPAEPVTPAGEVQPNVAPLTAESVGEMIQQAQQTGNQPILEALQGVQTALAQQATPPVAPPDATELAERLLTDPKAVFKEEVTEILKEQLAGPLTSNFETQRDERVDTRAAKIDETFGTGFFNENIRDRLTGPQGTLAGWPINQQADPRIIDSAINGIMGNDFTDTEKGPKLVEALQKTARAHQERAVAQPPHVMGPGRPRMPLTNTLTPDEKYILEGFQKAGIKVTEDEIKSAKARDNSLEAYRESVR
jgi:hypothetical protein